MRFAAFIAGACFALVCQPAHACSFSWPPGRSPKEIPHRADVWKVRGDFSLVDAKTGEVARGGEVNLTKGTGEMLGRFDRKGRKPIMTKQYYSELSVDCGAYLNPLHAASGTFWLEKQRDRYGRYLLLMWRQEKERPSPKNTESVPIQDNGKQ